MNYTETPLIEIKEAILDPGITLLVKREDLNHPHVSGNKWWKLQGNMAEAERQGKSCLLTFGGAFSNHIVATAAAAKENGLRSVGIIRGERVLPLNSSLAFAEKMDMQLNFISRDAYKKKTDPEYLRLLIEKYPDSHIIPEGGTNAEAIRSVSVWARKLAAEIDFDVVCIPAGTGGTLAGMIVGMGGRKQIIGISALKGEFLTEEVNRLLNTYSPKDQFNNWRIETDYHFGGYARSNAELENFIARQLEIHHLPLEPVYTGKLFYGVYDLLRKKKFKSPCKILVIHTGGLERMRGLSE